jgi:Ulp1 family protease
MAGKQATKDSDFHLIYVDQEITGESLATIAQGKCVAEPIVGFQMRYLERKYESLGKYAAFIPACTAQFFQVHLLEFTKPVFRSMGLIDYRFVFFPIVDISVETGTASHWSLVYIKRVKSGVRFRHFDSLGHTNRSAGLAFCKKLARMLDLEESSVEWLVCPRQRNLHDCGVYVMAYVDLFVESSGQHEGACARLTPEFVTEYRRGVEQRILEIGGVDPP